MEVLWVAVRERENPQRPPQDRMDPLNVPDHVLLRRYRLPRQAIMFLTGLLKNDLQRKTKRSCPLPIILQIMIALRFLASGSFQGVLAGTVGVSQSSVSRAVTAVCAALCHHVQSFVKFPFTAAAQIRAKQAFFEVAGFPNVLGAVDGTHIALKAPREEEEIYVNRKNFHSINVQIICDATLTITNVVAKWPGSTHDSFMLSNSALGVKFEEGHIPDGWLLGDSGYGQKTWLMTPILHPATEAEEKYSRAQMKSRSIVERCIGVLKSRFRCIDRSGGVLLYTPGKTCQIITSACILHNICMQNRLPLPDIPDMPDTPPADVPIAAAGCNAGIQARNDLIRRLFT